MRIKLEPDQVIAVFGVSVLFIYLSYWAALKTVVNADNLVLLSVIKLGYTMSSFVALNSLLMIDKMNHGELPDLDSKADLKDLMLCNGCLILFFWLSELGLLFESIKSAIAVYPIL